MHFYLDPGKKFPVQARGGVNQVSCRRGDLDFTLQEGGNGTLPPHAHVWLRECKVI